MWWASRPACSSICRVSRRSARQDSRPVWGQRFPPLRVPSSPLSSQASRPRATGCRQRLVLQGPRRGLLLAPAQRAGAEGEAVGDGPPLLPGLSGGQPLLVVRDGGDYGRDTYPKARLPRGRAQVPGLLHLPPGVARDANRRPRPLPALPVLGTWREHKIFGLDLRRRPARHLGRRPRSHAGLFPAPGLRPATLRPRLPRGNSRSEGQISRAAGSLSDFALDRGKTVVALSEYGITPSRRQIDINRRLREAGLLNVHAQEDMEYLDPWTSAAFAVADHQIAHVYVRDRANITRVKELLESLAGVGGGAGRGGKTRVLSGPLSGRASGLGGRDRRLVHALLLVGGRARP